MSPAQIAKQIIASASQQAERISRVPDLDEEERLRMAYLSGAMQTASFITRGEGLVTSQLTEQGIKLAGDAFGFTLVPPGG